MIEIKLDTSNVPLIALGNAPFDYALVKMKDGTEHFCKAEPYHGEPPSDKAIVETLITYAKDATFFDLNLDAQDFVINAQNNGL